MHQDVTSTDGLDDLRAEVGSLIWFHSIDLGQGVASAGVKSASLLQAEAERLGLPDDLSGQTVLDIGAWDGFFSFEAERRGASRVVALDHYAWSMDLRAQQAYLAECLATDQRPLPFEQVPSVWDERRLPGRAPFELAKRRLGSRVEPVVGDFMTMDLSPLGSFDVVLFLGVLYHLEDPFRALRRLRAVTRGRAFIETVCGVFPGMERHPIWHLFPSDELNGDPSNWWASNLEGLLGMCRAAGFGEARVIAAPGADAAPAPGHDFHFGRCLVQVFASA